MARERSPERDNAFEIYKQHQGNITNREIANQLNIPEKSVSGWKCKDKWDDKLNGVLQKDIRSTPKETEYSKATEESFPGQCEAIGHKSGERCRNKALDGERFCRIHLDGWEGQCTAKSKQTGERCKKKAEPGKDKCKFHGGKSTGPPPGSQNATKHGFFARIFPDDEETRAIVSEIMEKSPLDILWDQIVIQYTAIARAQKIMFVKDQDDLTKVLKRQKETSSMQSDSWEKEWELQFAWDKQAGFLKAQSTAMKTLEGLIARYEDTIQKGRVSEEHRLRLEKLKQDMDINKERLQLEKSKVMGDPEDTVDDGFIDALSNKAGDAWDGYADEGDQE